MCLQCLFISIQQKKIAFNLLKAGKICRTKLEETRKPLRH